METDIHVSGDLRRRYYLENDKFTKTQRNLKFHLTKHLKSLINSIRFDDKKLMIKIDIPKVILLPLLIEP